MLHNKASEGLIKPDRLGYDLYSGIADTKAFFLKYCKPFEKRIRSLVPNHRVVLAGDGEASTTVSVPGFLVDAKSKSKKAPLQVDLQFVEHHKTLYLDLHREFTKSEYAPQSEASLQNFKTLLLLEIAILLGCDLEWATGSSVGAAVADPPVLAAGAAADDDDASNSDESDAPGRAKHGAAARAPAPAEPNAGDDTNDAGGGGADAGGGGGADAAAEDGIVLDVADFTSWQPDTWQYVDYDKIQFPTDPMLSICSVRSYFAVAMILFYDLRESTPVRGMASPRRGRPPFTKTFRLEPWRSGLKTDHTASTLPNPLGWQKRYATLNAGRAGRRQRVGASYLLRLGRLQRIPRRHLDVIHRRPNVARVPRRSPATPIPCGHHPGF